MNAVVADNMIDGVEVKLGIDMIDVLEEVAVSRNAVKFGEHGENNLPTYSLLAEANDFSDDKLHITDRHFSAEFGGDS